jgi:Arc/MetJ-type ribon-helix-helix transcriptional regulator
VTDNEARGHIVSCRMSESEVEQLDGKMDEEGFANRSAYLRYLAGFDKQRVSMAARLAELEKQVQQLTNNRKG